MDQNTSAILDLDELEKAMLPEAWLTINHPQSGAPTATRIKLASPDSEHFRRADRRIKNRNNAAMMKGRRQITQEMMEASSLDLLAAVTLDWENVRRSGADLPFSEEEARKLYEEKPFIREQVDAFASDRVNFFVG